MHFMVSCTHDKWSIEGFYLLPIPWKFFRWALMLALFSWQIGHLGLDSFVLIAYGRPSAKALYLKKESNLCSFFSQEKLYLSQTCMKLLNNVIFCCKSKILTIFYYEHAKIKYNCMHSLVSKRDCFLTMPQHGIYVLSCNVQTGGLRCIYKNICISVIIGLILWGFA